MIMHQRYVNRSMSYWLFEGQAREQVNTTTIKNCFSHCGAMPTESEEELTDTFADLDTQESDVASLDELLTPLNSLLTLTYIDQCVSKVHLSINTTFGRFIGGHIRQVSQCTRTTSLLRPLLVVPRAVALAGFTVPYYAAYLYFQFLSHINIYYAVYLYFQFLSHKVLCLQLPSWTISMLS